MNPFALILIFGLTMTIVNFVVGDGVFSFDKSKIPDQTNNVQLQRLLPINQPNFLPWSKLTEISPNGITKCPDEQNHCEMDGGQFGCCSFHKGVCCADKKTCCPHGTSCDIKNSACASQNSILVPLPKQAIDANIVKSQVVCPDKKMECSDSETCCSVGYGSYGCCPMKNATCCADNASCCPHGKKCDLKKKMCVPQENSNSDIVERKSLISYYSIVGIKFICPDQTNCIGNHTCCPLGNNMYGCCLFDFGVCCPDLKTCCNNGYQCIGNGCKKNGA